MATHVLQGYASGIGWCDMQACKSELEAKAHMQAAINTESVFMPGTKDRKGMLRIVPAAEANCRYSQEGKE